MQKVTARGAAPLVIGHRGASREAPENTLASFRLAYEQGADGIEADFQVAADGSIVCLHDDSTLRTSGIDLAVRAATLPQLRATDVGRWKGKRWEGERIPTLDEVLAELPPGKRIFIELKSGAEIIAPLREVLERHAVPAESVRLLTFSSALVRLLKDELPSYRTCWLTDYRWRGGWTPSPDQVLATLRECGADGLASRGRQVLDEAFVEKLREASLEIHVWTVDAPADARRFALLGVDSIMTNRPEWLRGLLGERAAGPGREER